MPIIQYGGFIQANNDKNYSVLKTHYTNNSIFTARQYCELREGNHDYLVASP